MTVPADMQIGPYRVIDRIGAGGMAEVYKASHQGSEGLERLVALKRVIPSYAREPDIRTMFIDEARLLARLTHPYIVQIHELHPGDGGPWMVTEYIHGSDLRTLMAQADGGLPIDVGLRIGLDIAEALAYAHARRGDDGKRLGVVHRDLKPSNVMVREDGVVKLLDFGVAKAHHKVHQTRVGAIKGSLGYFAPEQIKDAHRLDHRADIFGLGILLYEALCGEHPFAPLDGPAVVMRIMQNDFLSPRAHRPELPASIDALVTACLALDPDDRPQTMEGIAETLADAMTRPLTFARLAAYVREVVPPSTLRAALPGFGTDAGLDVAGVGADEPRVRLAMPRLESLDLDPADITSSMEGDPDGPDEPRYDSLDIDGADPTALMAAPTHERGAAPPTTSSPAAPRPRASTSAPPRPPRPSQPLPAPTEPRPSLSLPVLPKIPAPLGAARPSRSHPPLPTPLPTPRPSGKHPALAARPSVSPAHRPSQSLVPPEPVRDASNVGTTPRGRTPDRAPPEGPDDELPTVVVDDGEMDTTAMHEPELPTFVADGRTLTVPARLAPQPRPVGGLALGLLLWGIIAGLIVALLVVLFAE